MDDATRERLLQRRAEMIVHDATQTPGPCRWSWTVWCVHEQHPGTISVHQSGRTRTKREANIQANAAIPHVTAAWKAMLGEERD